MRPKAWQFVLLFVAFATMFTVWPAKTSALELNSAKLIWQGWEDIRTSLPEGSVAKSELKVLAELPRFAFAKTGHPDGSLDVIDINTILFDKSCHLGWLRENVEGRNRPGIPNWIKIGDSFFVFSLGCY